MRLNVIRETGQNLSVTQNSALKAFRRAAEADQILPDELPLRSLHEIGMLREMLPVLGDGLLAGGDLHGAPNRGVEVRVRVPELRGPSDEDGALRDAGEPLIEDA